MVNNPTNINKRLFKQWWSTIPPISTKDSLNSDGQQSHQYQQKISLNSDGQQSHQYQQKIV